MSFLPAAFEIAAFILVAPSILHISRSEAAIIGAVLGAVSPTIVVPKMVSLIESRCGTGKKIPQLILAGSSLDDVFVIVLFSTFIQIKQGGTVQFSGLLNIPISIVLGILLGAASGFILSAYFNYSHRHGHTIRNSIKTIILAGTAFLLVAIEALAEGVVAVSGLLAVIGMACTVRIFSHPSVTEDLGMKFGKLWLAAEIALFVLVGAAVDIRYTLQAGIPAVLMILLGLASRSAGVLVSLTGSKLNRKEKLFCVIAYLPKATVQATIGAVPLSLGLPCGQLVLTIAVLSIRITAPAGALGMDINANIS